MHKKSGWRTIGTNSAIPMSEKEYKNYRNKMFKWGIFVDKMKTQKPKFVKKVKDSKEKENESE